LTEQSIETVHTRQRQACAMRTHLKYLDEFAIRN